MEYHKIANLKDGASNQQSKFRTRMNQEEHTMLIVKSSLKLQC